MSSLKINSFQQKINLPAKEKEVLDYWEKNDSFKKSVQQRSSDKPYIFYDGPPFATGTPHYGHILASTIKDVVPRYWTMKGYQVERVWGWDCHGLPIENIVEKQLDLKGGKKGIEELGVDKFNQACRNAIWKFDKEWERVIRRIGRWVDFKNSYKTMDTTYMESVWWAFKQLYKKGLVYQGRRVILYCTRCATPLSNFEIAMDNSYKDVKDHSIFVKFPLAGKTDEYLLAWTTTPWTLIGNVALAVNPKSEYVKIKTQNETLILAKKRLDVIDQKYQIIDTFRGKALANLAYQPLFSYLDIQDKKAYYVALADFVSLDEGTGIVHTAAIYGEDDYQLAVKLDLPLVPMLDDQGKYLEFVTPLKGMYYLKAQDWILTQLKQRNLLYKNEQITHSVAHCYRCNTKLFYNAVPAWFIDVQKLKKNLITKNQNINWYPDHLKNGRFGKGLQSAPDWNISRSRYWGTPMPIWHGEKTGKIRVIGSIEELKKWAVNPEKVKNLDDIHREFIDPIQVWVDDKKTEKGSRIPEVFDCWVESGSMPYASIHYPFENKQKFESSYPAQFIAEYIAQTRAWFYTLHVMSVGLFDSHAFKNAVTTGNILAEDGHKMSKSKKNYPDPEPFIEKYGVDALRFYLMGSVVMKADNINFSEDQVEEIYKKTINILWNIFTFLKFYSPQTIPPKDPPQPVHILDKWLVSITNSTIKSVTNSMDNYDTVGACRLIKQFITDFSTWYLRRSRDRIKSDHTAQQIFAWALNQLIHLMAPITPFVTELVYQNLKSGSSSIHLNPWPLFNPKNQDKSLETHMDLVRKIVETLHSLRQTASIPIKQPLSGWGTDKKTRELLEKNLDLIQVINNETNLKSFFSKDPQKKLPNLQIMVKPLKHPITIYLDTQLTPELKKEGQARDIIRQVQRQRKKLKTKINQKIELTLPDWPPEHEDLIKSKVLATNIIKGNQLHIKPL